ncbi:MAG: hypothetical protein SGCHY_004108 [Lobulomycetales sp.]
MLATSLPSHKWTKRQIQEFLSESGVEYTAKATKSELLDLLPSAAKDSADNIMMDEECDDEEEGKAVDAPTVEENSTENHATDESAEIAAFLLAIEASLPEKLQEFTSSWSLLRSSCTFSTLLRKTGSVKLAMATVSGLKTKFGGEFDSSVGSMDVLELETLIKGMIDVAIKEKVMPSKIPASRNTSATAIPARSSLPSSVPAGSQRKPLKRPPMLPRAGGPPVAAAKSEPPKFRF